MKYIPLVAVTIVVLMITLTVTSHPGPFVGDIGLAAVLQSLFNASSDSAFLALIWSLLGFLPWLAGGAVVVALILRQWRISLLIAASVSWSWFVMEPGFKYLVKRPRPTSDLIQIFDVRSGFGFPSGGALHSAVIVGVILYAFRKKNLLSRSAFSGAIGLGTFFCLAIGAGRIVSGAHWTSDVLSAWVMAAWVVIAAASVDRTFVLR
jgi:membrane-associated phospholipid phosphatase